MRLALAFCLVLLGACGDERLLGSAPEPVVPDGGLEPAQEDDVLAQYALELEGEWAATSPDGGAKFTVVFMRSGPRPRSGTVHWEVQLDCSIAVPANFPLPVRPCLSERDRDPPRFPEPEEWEAEYWVLKLDGTDAVVTMLPMPSQVEGVSFTCVYAPKPAPAQLKCGVTFLGLPFGSMTFSRPVR